MHRRGRQVVRRCLGQHFSSWWRTADPQETSSNSLAYSMPERGGCCDAAILALATLSTEGGPASIIARISWLAAGRQRRCMGESIAFESRVRHEHRRSLERLLFFNGCQNRVLHGIVAAIERYGPPEIVADGEFLRVRVAKQPDVQTLFAIDALSGRPIGVAVYLRADLEHVTVLHLGISEEYCAGGPQAATRLPLRLMRELRRSSSRLKGVRRLHVLYGGPRLRNLA